MSDTWSNYRTSHSECHRKSNKGFSYQNCSPEGRVWDWAQAWMTREWKKKKKNDHSE